MFVGVHEDALRNFHPEVTRCSYSRKGRQETNEKRDAGKNCQGAR